MRRAAVLALPALAVAALAAGPAFAEPTTLTAAMTAEEEVPSPGPAGATGMAQVTLDPDAGQLCYKLTYDGPGMPTAAHIHEGPAGQPGPVAIDFDIVANGLEACIPADATEMGHVAEEPDGHYVNIHTPEYPKGAVRGQLAPAS